MHNIMTSTYLEASRDGASISHRGIGSESCWMGGIVASAMPYTGQDASPYGAESPTNLHSPETPSLDNSLFPSPIGDFYFDHTLGDYPSSNYSVGDVPTAGQFPLSMRQRGSVALSDQYSVTSDPSPSLYTPGGMWPAQPAFLPTPPMADDFSDDSSPREEEEEQHPLRCSSSSRHSAVTTTRAKKRSVAQLRTASRAPRKGPTMVPQRPTETEEDVKARAAHNQVEQQYRKRLNLHFERLLAVLPPPTGVAGGRKDGIGEKRVSKAEVLDLATERIRTLERQMGRLEMEGMELRGRLAACGV
ncbi:hypothetical protein BGZ63DRAFT_391956 [Mariannaea sp. PMI_226]|nr:hypothetical protein BGZ63DRAFT_391956 [Mariannaea sp. PMI_226]